MREKRRKVRALCSVTVAVVREYKCGVTHSKKNKKLIIIMMMIQKKSNRIRYQNNDA